MISAHSIQVPGDTDGNLPAARQRLHEAISALIDPRPYPLEGGRYTWLDSLYMTLRDALTDCRAGTGGHQTIALPFWADAMKWLNTIDIGVHHWHPQWPLSDIDEYPTILRLQALDDRKWRPQDCAHINHMAANLEHWAIQITKLFEAKPKHLPNPCPRCGAKTVHRRTDDDDQPIRQPALQITDAGATCGQCHTTWPPEQLQFLGRLLGYPKPDGILDDVV